MGLTTTNLDRLEARLSALEELVRSEPGNGEGLSALATEVAALARAVVLEASPTTEDSRVAVVTVERDRLASLLDRLDYGVVTVDADLVVRFATAAAQRFLGEQDLVGRPLPDSWPSFSLRKLASDLFQERTPEASDETVRFDGQAYRVLALPPGLPAEVVILLEDVRVRERREQAEREFVANAAHQLRTPVSAIASAVEVLQTGAKESPAARDRFLAHIDRQCGRLVRLTRALLMLARAQALGEPPTLELVPLRPLLEHVAGSLHPGERVNVYVVCAADAAALTNRDLAEQAITNLAENAAKFTREGEIVLSAEPVGDGAVRIVVRDTGPGLEADDGRGLEARFARGANEAEGFGLGLAIASETARALGGRLDLESSSGGTQAALTLPAAELRSAGR